ncbi:MAG: hypothetical protein QOF78_1274 [Phycisphaerales bacterium]|nr:hypothetical protein [Phycisphaerales bacterium]
MRRSRIYLEFGCGGSTRLAAESGVSRLFSVDSDKNWVKRCRRHPSIAPLVADGRAILLSVKVGTVDTFGYPADRSDVLRWPNYSLAIWKKIGVALPDTVLIDGRWRVSTAVQSLLRCPPKTTMMFHDFTPRAHYHAILPFIDVVETVDSLLVYRAKPDLDLRRLIDLAFASLLVAR